MPFRKFFRATASCSKLPMKTILKVIKISSVICLTLFATLLVYANWETPPMHARVKPVRLVVYQIAGMADSLAAKRLESQLSTTTGVSAAVVNYDAKIMSLSFHEDEVSESELREIAGFNGKYQLSIPNYESVESSGPQCPVPMEYILTFERIKYALCFR